MLNIIIGENASGKTYILNQLLLKHENAKDVATNLQLLPTVNSIPFSKERIEYVNDVIESASLITNHNYSVIDEFDEYSLELLNIITYLCKDVSNVFLDEPSAKLPVGELSQFSNILYKLSNVIPNLWITTHDGKLKNFNLESIKYYTVYKDLNNEYYLKEL